MDNLTKEQRHKSMSSIRSNNTSIEVTLAKAMWAKGWRYRKNNKSVFGKPDFTFKTKKIAIFCDSEFWHGKDWEITKKRFDTNKDYWVTKIERNIQRDKEVNKELKKQGWSVIRFWGKDITKNLTRCIEKVEKQITNK